MTQPRVLKMTKKQKKQLREKIEEFAISMFTQGRLSERYDEGYPDFWKRFVGMQKFYDFIQSEKQELEQKNE